MADEIAEKSLPVHKRIKELIEHITSGLRERNQIMRLSLLACISGEDICYFGPTGTGKSTMIKKLKSAFVSRLTSKIKVCEIPLKHLSASPVDFFGKHKEIEPVWEDFLFRFAVYPIKEHEAFLKLITSKKSDSEFLKSENAISSQDLSAYKSQIDEIKIPSEVQDVLTCIRKKISTFEKASSRKATDSTAAPSDKKIDSQLTFYISDARWVKIAHLLKTSAFLNGRKSVDLMDCELVSYCIADFACSTAEKSPSMQEISNMVGKAILESENSFEDELSQIEFSIKEYDDYIEKTFYITQDGKKVKNPALFGYTKPSEPNIFKMNDGQVAYRIMHPSEIRSYDYITPRYVSKEAYYDEKKDRVEKNSRYRDKYFVKNLVIENGKAVWTDGDFNHEYSFAVQMIPEDFIKGDEEKLSELNAQSAQKFNSLSESVKKEIEKIQKYRRSKERQYKANLFTEKLNYDNLMSKIQGAEERILRLAQGLDSSLRSE